MGEASGGQTAQEFLAAINVGDLCCGTVAEVTRSEASVTLDGLAAGPLGVVGASDVSWRRRMAEAAVVGQRITAEVIAVDLDEGRVRLAMTATENPELWAFLKRLRRGETLAGTVASKKSDTDECSIAGYMKSSTGNYYTPNLEVC
ncbi:S1 RNA-binding domain-containing protein [Streptomyces scabiei]|uniref:S1 RNA-binding domain-containing protein n=2 Tax=Streptomyces TaxID=1883 RepID=UPI0039F456B8